MENKDPIKIIVDNKIYDVTKFAKIHPGGDQIMREFNNCDCTDYFYALHSKNAGKQLKNMPSTPVAEKDRIPESNIAKLSKQLEKDGWMKADYFMEGVQLVHTIGSLFMAGYLADSYPFFAALFIASGTLIGGWVGHMCDHQRDNPMKKFNLFYSTLIEGMSPMWWSYKHNRHHLSCNEKEYDGDIQLFPFIYLWTPKKSQDAWNRRFQNIYFTALYTILHLKWQIDSLFFTYQMKKWDELALLIVHWAWLLSLPWKVWLCGVLLSGFIAAWVVTTSHQAEVKLDSKKDNKIAKRTNSQYEIHDFAEHQIRTTRNFYIETWFGNYISGCMQYQTEHHLFPRIPMYKLSQVRPIVMKYCKENGLDYMEDTFWQIMGRNYQNIDMFATVKAE